MRSIPRLLGKLRGRSVAELRGRALQQAAMLDERLRGTTLPAPPRGSESAKALFAGLEDPRAVAALLRARLPGWESRVVERARRVASGRFQLLGYDDLSFGDPVDWRLDPVHGRRAPLVHWSRVPYLDPEVVGDHKVVWELNRMQWLVTLGQAYAITGDERHAATFASLVTSWMDANPPKRGINWASSLEVGFRAISWVWALQLFRDSASLTPALRGRMLAYLELHGRHLDRYLSTWFSPNTHLTGEALALVYLGLGTPELPHAARWLGRGVRILEEWLPRHARPDGVYFEQATQYHRYTTDFYTHLVLLAGRAGLTLAPHVRPTLERLLEHLMHLARPDGTIPLFGDDDGGRLVQLDDRTPDDARATLAVGAAIFGRADFAFAGGGELAPLAWLMGDAGLRAFDAIDAAQPSELSRLFPDGGIAVVRDGWSGAAMQLVVDAGPHGSLNCAHSHADALSLELFARGRPLLVDAGTYTYPGAERDAFRATAAHNSVTVDGRSSSEPAGPFAWSRVARTTVDRWLSTPRFDLLEAHHDGYAELPSRAVHQRSLLFVRGDYAVVIDRVTTAGNQEVTLWWHCAPGLEASVEGAVARISSPGAGVQLAVTTFGAGPARVERSWVSPQYGRKLPAAVLAVSGAARGVLETVTFLLPARADGDPPAAEELAASVGHAFRLSSDHGEDLLLLGASGPVGSHRLHSDASRLWLRFGPDGEVREWFAVDARRVEVNGRVLLDDAVPAPWRMGGGEDTNR